MNENRTRIRAIALGMMIIGMATLPVAPSALADGPTADQSGSSGSCVTIFINGPGVAIDPESCKRPPVVTVEDVPSFP